MTQQRGLEELMDDETDAKLSLGGARRPRQKPIKSEGRGEKAVDVGLTP